MRRLKNLNKKINEFSSEKPKKFLGIQLLLILAVTLMLYPSASDAGGGIWALFIALSLALVLIPFNTYIYEKGFVKTSIISLFSAFILPAIGFILLMLSPGNGIAALFIFFAILGASLSLGYLAPPLVLVIHYLKERRGS